MAETRLVNFNTCCRLCLSDTMDNLKSIFDDNLDDRGLQQKISASLGVEIMVDDKLSTMVCQQCIEKINNWQSYKLTCSENQTKLEQWMSLSNSELSDMNIQIKEEPVDHEVPDVIINGEIPVKNEPVEEEYNDLPPPLTPQGAEDGDVEVVVHSPGSQLNNNDDESDDPRKCNFCGKVFSSSGNRKKHQRMIHGVKSYSSANESDGEVSETANSAAALPDKSRMRYKQEHLTFLKWCRQKKIKMYTEDVLLDYFIEKSETLKYSTLWPHYSMLRSTLAVEDNVDISKFSKLIAFLKSKAVGYRVKKSQTFSREEISTYLREAPDDIHLMMKVVLIMGIFGACRTEELLKMTTEDIEDKGTILIVTIPDSRTHIPRTFAVNDGEQKLLTIYRKYANLRPKHTDHKRFFVIYRYGKCTVQPVGKNTFGQIPRKIAEFLKLPDPKIYTGHCFRRTSATLTSNPLGFKKRGRGKSSVQ